MGYPERIAWSGKQLAYLDHGTLTAKAGRSSTTIQWHPIFGLPHDRLCLSTRSGVRWCYSVVVITRDFDRLYDLPETQVRTLVAPVTNWPSDF